MVQKEGGDTWQVPAWFEVVFEDSGAVPPYGWASTTRRRRLDTRGLSQHKRASLYNNPRRGKCLSGEKRKEKKLLYSVITGKQSTTRKRRIKSPVSLVSRVSGNLITLSYLDPGFSTVVK